jgi:hypothetical protein
MAAERLHKHTKDIIDTAEKTLRNHLRYRRALNLDDEDKLIIPAIDDNPLFRRRLMPYGDILSVTDRHNRLLWYIEYASISVEVCLWMPYN